MANKVKREELRKKAEARQGLSPEQVAELDAQDALEEEIHNQALALHVEMFPEEYDYRLDSCADAQERKRGINPMNQDYIDKVAKKRMELGVSPLAQDGMPASKDSYQVCLGIIRKKHQNS